MSDDFLRKETVENEDHVQIEIKPEENNDEQKNTSMAEPLMINPHNRTDNFSTYFTCPICFDEKSSDEVWQSLGCSHTLCKPCVTDYLLARIDENKIIDIKCPFEGCAHIFSESDIQEMLEPSSFEKYKAHKENKLLAKNLNIHYCPNPVCSKPFTPNLKDLNTTCTFCETVICHKCWHKVHEGKPCDQSLNENLRLLFDEYDIRHCIICKTPAERSGGCPIMVCPVCDYHWCWRCGRHYEMGHEFLCKRKWNPVHPDQDHKGIFGCLSRTMAKFLGLIAHILVTILSPFLALLFWPMMSVFKDKATIKKPCSFLGYLLLNFLLAIVALPCMIFMVLGTIIYHFFKYQLPWIGYCLTCKCFYDDKLYRWKNKKEDGFEYQNKHDFPHAIALM